MSNKKQIKRLYNIVVLLLLAGAVWYILGRTVHCGNVEYTDDAQVQRHITPVHTRVQGFIKEIRFNEYGKVKKGDTLVIIDNSEYLLQVARAEANLRASEMGSTVISAGINTTASNVDAANAGIDEARVTMENARDDFYRYEELLKRNAVTRQQYDAMKTRYLAALARYEQAAAHGTSTSRIKDEQTVRLSQNEENIAVAQSMLNLSRLNLSYTVITASTDGVMGRKDIHEGQLVQPGQLLARIVDACDVWVVANYRESQLGHIAVGNEVSITADALPGVQYSGVVESLSPATGAAYSMVPADNATGNFVKVEQRVPVRIRITTQESELLERLISGLNVETEVKY
ncbi:MAG: HlyD family secretion protein [Muribaculaceae bacterium]